jgi:hypothetical protein
VVQNIWVCDCIARIPQLGLYDCHLGMWIMRSLILNWGLGLSPRRPLLGRGPFFLSTISQNSERTSVEVWTVDQPCTAVFIRGNLRFQRH